MAPRIQSVATRFHLYSDVHDTDAAQLQMTLTANNAKTDHGLRFNKFFGRWQNSDTPELVKNLQTDETQRNGNPVGPKPTQPILDWLDPRKNGNAYRVPGHAFKTLKAGNAAQLTSACDRLASLARRGTHFDLNLISRLLIGTGLPHPSENGMLFHPTLGVPYVSGSALKQVAQDWAEEEEGLKEDDETRLRLFGGAKHGVGCLAFLDALPCEPVTLTAEQITNHYPGYYQNIDPAKPSTPRSDTHQPADWYDPNPVTMLAVEAGFASPLPFRFVILPLRGANNGDVAKAVEWLSQGLEIYGVGARTTVGFGRFMTDDALEQLKQVAIREAEAEKARQKVIVREQAEAEFRAQQVARSNWIPAINDAVIYEHAEDGDDYHITELAENGDFTITRIGGNNGILTDKTECKPLPKDG